jgi:hypothetical protein
LTIFLKSIRKLKVLQVLVQPKDLHTSDTSVLLPRYLSQIN